MEQLKIFIFNFKFVVAKRYFVHNGVIIIFFFFFDEKVDQIWLPFPSLSFFCWSEHMESVILRKALLKLMSFIKFIVKFQATAQQCKSCK